MSGAPSARQHEVQRIADALSQAILQQRLKPGMRLVEAQLVEALSANRNHVQTALQRLSLLHVVTIQPNRGARIAEPGVQEARDVFAARRAIESAIVTGICAAKMAEHRAAVDHKLLAEEPTNVAEQRCFHLRQEQRFHMLLATINGNQVLYEMLANLMVRSALVVARYQRQEQPPSRDAEYRQVLEALRAGEMARAQSTMNALLLEQEAQLELNDEPDATLSLREALLLSVG